MEDRFSLDLNPNSHKALKEKLQEQWKQVGGQVKTLKCSHGNQSKGKTRDLRPIADYEKLEKQLSAGQLAAFLSQIKIEPWCAELKASIDEIAKNTEIYTKLRNAESLGIGAK